MAFKWTTYFARPDAPCLFCGAKNLRNYRIQYGNPVHSWEEGVGCPACNRIRLLVRGPHVITSTEPQELFK